MVWSATTLWAETSDGSFRERWIRTLKERGMTSAILSVPVPRSRYASPPPAGDGGDMSWSDSDRSPSPIRAVQEQRNVAERQALVEKLETSEVVHTERARAARTHRLAMLKQRRQSRDAHTHEVIERAQEHLDARVQHAKASIRERERRFLPAIDQCETQEEVQTLRAASFCVMMAVQRMIFLGRYHVQVGKMVRTLRLLLLPVMALWRCKRHNVARVYAGVWRGKCNRPSVATMRAIMPLLQSWTSAAVQKLIRRMRPMSCPAGRRIFSDGEPGVAALYISSGRVAVRQPRLHAPPLELGERGAAYLHAEDVLLKETQTRHFTHLHAVEATYGWYVTRRAYREVAAASQDQGDLLTATQVAVSNNASKTEEYTAQALENNKRLLSGWVREELSALIEHAKERSVERGEAIYRPGDRATCGYLVVRGTILLAQQVKRAAHAGGSFSMPSPGGDHTAPGASSTNLPFASGGVAAIENMSFANTNAALFAVTATADGGGGGVGGGAGALSLVEGEEFAKEYANAGQMVGVESLLFSCPRTEYCICATDCVVLELAHTPFINGMFSDPIQLIANKEHFNLQRSLRLIAPTLSQLHVHLHQQPIASFFLKNMFPIVVARGEQLPLQTCAVYIQYGVVELESHVFRAPCVLIAHNALLKIAKGFEAAMKSGTLELVRPDKDPTRIAAAAAAQQPFAEKGAGGGTGAVRGLKKLRAAVAVGGAGGLGSGNVSGGPSTTSSVGYGGGSTANDAQAPPGLMPSTSPPGAADNSDQPSGDTKPAAEVGDSQPTSDGATSEQPASGAAADGGGSAADAAATAAIGAPQTLHTPAAWGYIPLAGSLTLVVKQPFARDADPGDGSGRVRFRNLPSTLQLSMLSSDLLEGTMAMHKTTTRVEAWGVRYLDVVRKFHGGGGSGVSATNLSDFVQGDLLTHLTPVKVD